MRISSGFIVTTLLITSKVCATEELLKYKITPECIESIDISESSDNGYWNINIELTASESLNLYSITQKNLGRKFVMVDARENEIGLPPATLHGPLPKNFRLAGFDSLDKAEITKKQILSNAGACGLAPIKPINAD
ncbi:hypothetical protein [Pseudoalteromonas xiamenensis]